MYKNQEKQNKQINWIPAFAGMTDNQLLLQTKNLVQKERQINIQVLQHLQEIESRKLYLEKGFPSLFEYAIKELVYSHSAAYRRIKAMRLCRDIPQATLKIKTGSLNLTTASQLQTFFEKKKRKDKTQVLKANNSDKCDAKSTFLPAAGCVKDNVDKDKKEENKLENKPPIELNPTQKLELIKQAEGQSSRELERTLFEIDPEVCNEKEKIRDINNNKVEIKVILDKDCQQKLEDLKKLLSHKNPNMSYGELINLLAELGLNKYDPKRRINKQNRILSKTPTPTQAKKTTDKNPKKLPIQTTKQRSLNNQKYLKPIRYIPSVVKHHIWMRDQGQCTYVCPKTKRKCSSNHLLQIDHIKPFSLGGTHEADNLRLLCANHNQFTFSRYQKYIDCRAE